MLEQVVTLKLPEGLYRRLLDTAQATKRSVQEVMLRAMKMGAPPVWDDVPAEFQADLAGMDRLDDETLWKIARGYKTEEEMAAYDQLLEKNKHGDLTETEHLKLEQFRIEADRFMLRKAHAAALLRWRGHSAPILG